MTGLGHSRQFRPTAIASAMPPISTDLTLAPPNGSERVVS